MLGTALFLTILTRKVLQELHYAVFNVDDENPSIVGSVYFLHELITKPQLQRTTAWGDMSKAIKGPEQKKNFLSDFSGYVNFLKSKISQCLSELLGVFFY